MVSANSWAHKILRLHLQTEGLIGENFLTKYIPILHYSMLLPIIMYVCQAAGGVIWRLKTNNFTLDQIVLTALFGICVLYNLKLLHFLLYNRRVTLECVRSAEKTLNCASKVDEELMWRKVGLVFKYFTLSHATVTHSLGLAMVIASHVARFKFHIGKSWFVVYPGVWYPMNVMTSQWFWVAYAFESLIFCYSSYLYSCVNSAFLYVLMTTKVKIDVLTRFFLEIGASGNDLQKSSRSKNVDRMIAEMGQDIKLERLKKGMEDMSTLRRQTRLIRRAFGFYISSIHFVALMANAIMGFATFYELRSTDKSTKEALAGSALYLCVLLGSLGQIYALSHLTTLIGKAQDNLSLALWQMSWLPEGREFKKFIILAKVLLNQSLPMKAYSYYHINLNSFNRGLIRGLISCSFIKQQVQ